MARFLVRCIVVGAWLGGGFLASSAQAQPNRSVPGYFAVDPADADWLALSMAWHVVGKQEPLVIRNSKVEAAFPDVRKMELRGFVPAPGQNQLFTQAPRVVIAPAQPRALLLQTACLAGALKAPLLVCQDGGAEAAQHVQRWGSQEVYWVGNEPCKLAGSFQTIHLRDEQAVAQLLLELLAKAGPINTLVLANASDVAFDPARMSNFAPLIALTNHGVLLLTNDAGDNVAQVVARGMEHPLLKKADTAILVGNLKAIPPEKRVNPQPGKDETIECEPLTPKSGPCSFAVGRVFHQDPTVVSLMLARKWRENAPLAKAGHQALLVSNPGGGLPLLETFSRVTACELKNAGFKVTALFGDDVERSRVRALLPEQTIFLWEGHHNTLAKTYAVQNWSEPLQPSLVFLQSCLALTEAEAGRFQARGALAVLGSTTRTYSGSGGALSLAVIDGLVHEEHTLGQALRHGQNFLLAFAQLKEQRLDSSQLGGANRRTAWAFSLWGEPTLKLPRPTPPKDALTPVRHHWEGNTLVLALPKDKFAAVASDRYQTQAAPNVRLAGLVLKKEGDEPAHLAPLIFREVVFPTVEAGKTPHLTSRLSQVSQVLLWDARLERGYLLVRPPRIDGGEIRFKVAWK